MLFKLKHWFFLILCLLVIQGCQTRRSTGSFRKPNQRKEQAKADKEKEKKKAEYRKSREKARKKYYDIQASSTKSSWDKNTKYSTSWIKHEFHRKSVRDRIRSFFGKFKREAKPDDGLFSEKQKRRSKGNLFQKIFKKKKRKK